VGSQLIYILMSRLTSLENIYVNSVNIGTRFDVNSVNIGTRFDVNSVNIGRVFVASEKMGVLESSLAVLFSVLIFQMA
jgi:hypothetical protein